MSEHAPATTSERLSLPDHAPAAQPVAKPRSWTDERKAEVWARLLTHIADGGSLDAFCALPDTPHKDTVYGWIRSDPKLADEYTRAREVQGDSYADQVADAAKKVLDGKLDAQAGRTAIDALKWLAAKRKPKVYGDRIDVNANVNVNQRVGWVIDLSAPGTPVLDGTAVSASDALPAPSDPQDVVAE